jgi:hypothetical protein
MVEHNDHDRDAAFKIHFNAPDVTTEPHISNELSLRTPWSLLRLLLEAFEW